MSAASCAPSPPTTCRRSSGEEMARQFARWSDARSSGCALQRDGARRLPAVPVLTGTTRKIRKWNLWKLCRREPRGRERPPRAGRRHPRGAGVHHRRRAACCAARSRELMAECSPAWRSPSSWPSTARCWPSTGLAGCSATTPRSAGASCSERPRPRPRRVRTPAPGDGRPGSSAARCGIPHPRVAVDDQQLDPGDLAKSTSTSESSAALEHRVWGPPAASHASAAVGKVRLGLPDGRARPAASAAPAAARSPRPR